MKINKSIRHILALAPGEKLTDSREFTDPKDVGKEEKALMSKIYRLMKQAKEFGDECTYKIYNSRNFTNYAVFVVVEKVSVGELNPIHKAKEKPKYEKRGRPSFKQKQEKGYTK